MEVAVIAYPNHRIICSDCGLDESNRRLDRQHLTSNRMLDGFKGHRNTSKYAKLAKCSTDTALRDIQSLLTRGLLTQNPGGGHSTSYRLPSTEELIQE